MYIRTLVTIGLIVMYYTDTQNVTGFFIFKFNTGF